MKKRFEIKKQRNLDQIIEDTFKFFKWHIKPIIKIIWKQNRFIILGLFASYFLYVYYYFGYLNTIIKIDSKQIGTRPPADLFTTNFALIALALFMFSIIFLPRFFAAITGYIKYYQPDTNSADTDKVKEFVNNKFWSLIGLTIVIFILFILITILSTIFIGLKIAFGNAGTFLMIALLLPIIIYSLVYFTLVYYIYIFEDVDISTALSQTRQYLKERFWFTLLVIVLMIIILWLIGMVVNLPITVYVMVKTFMMIKQPDVSSNLTGDIFVSTLLVISYVAQLIIRTLFIIAMSFLYFSLKEYHTNEGLHEKINQLEDDYDKRDF